MIGLLVGAMAGGAAVRLANCGLTLGGDIDCGGATSQELLAGVAVGAVLGGMAGAAIGQTRRGERWQTVSLGAGTAGGGPAVEIRLRFGVSN